MLENAVYRIKTQVGLSKHGYSHSEESLVFGPGQGSKSSPPTWNINGSLYFDVYDKHCHGANYVDLESLLQLRIGMAGFVDDNSVPPVPTRVNHCERNRGCVIVERHTLGKMGVYWNTANAHATT